LREAEDLRRRQIVDTVIGAVPEDWFPTVRMDWSGGLRPKMAQEYPRLSRG